MERAGALVVQPAISQRVSARPSSDPAAIGKAGSCGLQRIERPGLRAARGGRARLGGYTPWILLVACLAAFRLSGAAAAPAAARAGAFSPPLARPPLDPPLAITGGFGEFRIGHFHAGVDLGTGARVGKPVFAPLAGHVERVRASGVGYGRSVYIRADDGRLIQLGHLDAFVEPIASYVAAVQESTGQYEQDLWPEASRFRVRAGQRIAWSGQSGAGGPHLHFEIRRGDMALNPLRAGLALADTRPPSLASLTLEPLDDTSFVERGAAPYGVALGARAETLVVEGRVRAVVGAPPATASGVGWTAWCRGRSRWNGTAIAPNAASTAFRGRPTCRRATTSTTRGGSSATRGSCCGRPRASGRG
jgi:hypothetical protein